MPTNWRVCFIWWVLFWQRDHTIQRMCFIWYVLFWQHHIPNKELATFRRLFFAGRSYRIRTCASLVGAPNLPERRKMRVGILFQPTRNTLFFSDGIGPAKPAYRTNAQVNLVGQVLAKPAYQTYFMINLAGSGQKLAQTFCLYNRFCLKNAGKE